MYFIPYGNKEGRVLKKANFTKLYYIMTNFNTILNILND